jgi:hypothetical protein
MLCCESLIEERSAGNPHATFCGNRRRVTASGDPVAVGKLAVLPRLSRSGCTMRSTQSANKAHF